MVDKASVETDIGAAPPRPLAARERLGALLVHKGLITLEQLEATLSEAPPGSRIGELLVSRQLVDEEDIAKALADQYGQRFLELSSSPPDPEVARLLPEQLARRYNAILRALLEQPTANLLAEAVRNSMSTLHDDALRLCAAGTTSSDEVRRALGRGLEPLAGAEQGPH
jgi:hypothetical protein